jgi:anti-sigma B factor antagonist
MDLALTFETIGPCAVLHCDGRIVFGPQSDCLVRRCTQIFASHPAVGLQLSGVTRLDSGGVGSLVRILNTARKQGKELAIISPSEKVTQVLAITNLTSVFTIYSSVEEFFTPPLKHAAATA